MTGDRIKLKWFQKRKPSSTAAVNKSRLPSTQSTPAPSSSTSIPHQPAETHPSASAESLPLSEDGLNDASVADPNDATKTAAPPDRKGMILAVSKQVVQAFGIALKFAPIPNLDLVATGLLKFLEAYEVSLTKWAPLKP